MQDKDKTKGQLLKELAEMRRQVAGLEKSELSLKLRERVKELNYFYHLSALVEKPKITLEKLFQGAADLIPPSWQYPEITCGRIILEDSEFKTKNFKKTSWKQASDIIVRGKRSGAIEVYYLKKRPKSYEGPFLKEERKLIDTIAKRLGRITERKRAEENLRESEEKYRSLVKAVVDAIILLDTKGTVLLINDAAIILFGKPKAQIIGKNLKDLLPAEIASTRMDVVKKVVETKQSTVYVGWQKKRNLESVFSPVFDGEGNVIGVTIVARDITDRSKKGWF